jgi:hypothetical protein
MWCSGLLLYLKRKMSAKVKEKEPRTAVGDKTSSALAIPPLLAYEGKYKDLDQGRVEVLA